MGKIPVPEISSGPGQRFFSSFGDKVLLTDGCNLLLVDVRIKLVLFRGLSPRREVYDNLWRFGMSSDSDNNDYDDNNDNNNYIAKVTPSDASLGDLVLLSTKGFVQIVYIGDGTRVLHGLDSHDIKKITELVSSGQFERLQNSPNFAGILEKMGITPDMMEKMKKIFDQSEFQNLPDGSKALITFWDLNPGNFFRTVYPRANTARAPHSNNYKYDYDHVIELFTKTGITYLF